MEFKKRLAIELGITFVLIAGLVGGILFFSSRFSKSIEEMKGVRAELSVRSRSLNAVAALRSEHDTKVKDRMRILVSAVPEKDQLINLSKDFQLISTNEGLQSTFTFLGEAPSTDHDLGRLNFKLSTNGDFDKLIAFVKTLNNFHYLSSFDSFSLVRSGAESSLNTRGSVFFRSRDMGSL